MVYLQEKVLEPANMYKDVLVEACQRDINSNFQEGHMRRISTSFLQPGMQLAQSVFAADGRVLLARGQVLRESYIERLRQLGVWSVYIVDPRFPDLEVESIISEQTRVQAIKTIRTVCHNVLAGNASGVPTLKEVVELLIDDLAKNPRLMINVLDIRTHDDYTFAHSVNVCSFSLLVGMSMGLHNGVLRELGVGALMHDLGKTLIPSEILNKPGPLTPEEYECVKRHSTDGFNILRRQDEISLLSAHVAFQHHERQDGTGYPRGLEGDDVHLYARIVSVADVYDALASDRSYRARFLPHEAAEWLMANSGLMFDAEVVRLFLQKVAFYPVGSMVRLSNGFTGVVVDINQPMTTRPIIRLLTDPNGQAVDTLEEIDLVKHTDLLIVDVIHE